MPSLIVLVLLVAVAGCGPAPWTRRTFNYAASQGIGTYDVYRPSRSPIGHPAVVYFHGGGFMGGDKSEAAVFADDLCGRGYTVIAPNYQLSSLGARWPTQLEDAWAALRNIRANAGELGIVGPLAVMGSSAGGMLATLVHLRDDPLDPGHRPVCCVDVSGEMDLTLAEDCFSNWGEIMGYLLGPGPRYSPATLLAMSPIAYARPDAHLLVLHSTGDTNVYVANADRMVAALEGADVRYCRFIGYAHGDKVWTTCASAQGETYAFLDRQLVPR